jgi:riboflavin kinase/FMN adenylyltransferase
MGVERIASYLVRIVTDLTTAPFEGERSVVTIGAYDGVHLGHQAVIAHVRRLAQEANARSVVITFDRHPASVVRPESAPKLLTDLDQKLELLEATGVDATAVVRFDQLQAQEEPLAFMQRVLVDCLSARAIVVGDDFHFGRGRGGNVSTLREFGASHDFEVFPLPLVPRTDGPDEPVSSTAIRRAMALLFNELKLVVEPSGAVPLAALLEGRVVAAGQEVLVVLSGGNVDLNPCPWCPAKA